MSSYGVGVGDLVIKIGADVAGLRKNVSSAAKSLGSLEVATNTLSTALKAVGAAVAAAGLVKLAKDQLDAIDSTAKLARQLGGTVDGLRSLQLAASDAGVDSGALQASLEALNKKLGEAARTGKGEAFDAFQRLGLSARELGAMDVDQRIAAISDALKEQGLSAYQAADALAKMGLEQGQIVRLMLDGGDAVRAASDEIVALGLSLSEVDAAKVEAANDAMARIKLVTEAVIQRFTVGLAPALEVVATEFVDLFKGVDDWEDVVDSAVSLAIKGLGFVGDIVMGLEFGFRALQLGYTLTFAGLMSGLEGVGTAVELVTGKQYGWTQELHGMGDAARAGVDDVVNELNKLSEKDWPSTKAERMLEEIRNRSSEARESVRGLMSDLTGPTGPSKSGNDGPTSFDFSGMDDLGVTDPLQRVLDDLARKEELERESLERQLEQLRQFSLSAEQIEMERFAKQTELLAQSLDAKIITAERANSVMESIERKHMDAIGQIRRDGMQRAVDMSVNAAAEGAQLVMGIGRALTANMDQNSREMFEMNKAFSIVDALISGARGVAQTMGSYPFPYNIPLAVAHAGMAAAQVATISATQFSGGKSAGAGSVMAPSARGVGAAAGPAMSRGGPAHGEGSGAGTQMFQVNLQGDTFSRNTVIALMEQMNELTADGVRIAVR